MPYALIKKLNTLVSLDFPSQLQTDHPCLNQSPVRLPTEVEDLIDEIVEQACSVLGTQREVQPAQQRILREHGYVLTFDGRRKGCVWHTGVIHTPKGLINYF